jgi:DNA polymerase III sliding clamp (beta) subunit (PCNA family)
MSSIYAAKTKVAKDMAISSKLLLRALKSVIRAVSEDPTRPHLSCVHFDPQDDQLNVVGTNGHWIAVWNSRDVGWADKTKPFSITRACALRLIRELSVLTDRDIVFEMDTKRVEVEDLGSLCIEIEGEEYPAYRKVIHDYGAGHSQPSMLLGVKYLTDVAASFADACVEGKATSMRFQPPKVRRLSRQIKRPT